MKFSEIAFTAYPAVDLEKSRAFYSDLLGLTPTMDETFEESGGGWIEYELGAHVLAVGKAPGMDPSSNGPTCGLECENFEETIAALKAADVTFSMEPFETPVCHMAIVLDPAGNSLIIHKRKPGHG